ncbi:GNAT family N-acetyltransferase [Pseudomonas mohnii]|jgi:CelD/BcsL family acetyltransferase involved in cellulose biosynthesis|uniref:GNAT family N-acetyltransferase n=1 Tax=Pseudomonas sp. MIL9 TaxID=2807620 RepID=UPI0010299300|nr:GNAT family N-acetyltransferase [Pseudomonas sp. MIL9]MBM6445485.1 GNAT family N-acetyltransferase [Pseudomonas sp. MIL9]RZO09693.1 GNAT family N-acetyltransferase [Pseudomonas moorei]
MLTIFRGWRERGWTEIDRETYEQAWQRFGGSFATHPVVVERLSGFVGVELRYLGWLVDGAVVAAVASWGRHVALSKEVLKREGKRGLLDMGNAEIILPIAPDVVVPVRQRMAYVSQLNAAQISTLRAQPEGLALARAPEDYSKKFRYNQRREQRLLEEAGGALIPMAELTPQEQAAAYSDLFERRWGFAVPGKAGLIEVFTLLREFMTGSVVMLDSAPVAIQILYRVEAPQWVSLEYINGGVDPQSREFSPGSVLSFVNTQQAWADAQALGKTLRYSFGRADREYKDRWCHTVPVYQV